MRRLVRRVEHGGQTSYGLRQRPFLILHATGAGWQIVHEETGRLVGFPLGRQWVARRWARLLAAVEWPSEGWSALLARLAAGEVPPKPERPRRRKADGAAPK